MRKNAVLLLFILLSLSLPLLASDLSAIHANALPQETAVLAALDDARELEPYSKSWTMKWEYPIPKEDVVARLGKDLGFLTLAMKGHPDNAVKKIMHCTPLRACLRPPPGAKRANQYQAICGRMFQGTH